MCLFICHCLGTQPNGFLEPRSLPKELSVGFLNGISKPFKIINRNEKEKIEALER